MSQTILENWSRDYVIAPEIDVNTHEGEAILDEGAYRALVRILGEPIIGFTGGIHYEFRPSSSVMADRAAVPKRNHRGSDWLTLLLAK